MLLLLLLLCLVAIHHSAIAETGQLASSHQPTDTAQPHRQCSEVGRSAETGTLCYRCTALHSAAADWTDCFILQCR